MNLETVYTAAMTKTAAADVAVQVVNKVPWYKLIGPAIKGIPGWIGRHPKTSGSLGLILASFGLGTLGGYRQGQEDVAQTNQDSAPDPMLEAFKKFPNMGKQNWISTAAGLGAGAATGVGLHQALKAVPGLKKRKILRATLATLGGGGAGYLAWRAADNYQNASNNNQTA